MRGGNCSDFTFTFSHSVKACMQEAMHACMPCHDGKVAFAIKMKVCITAAGKGNIVVTWHGMLVPYHHLTIHFSLPMKYSVFTESWHSLSIRLCTESRK